MYDNTQRGKHEQYQKTHARCRSMFNQKAKY